jgi:hypothetical protein
VIDEEEWLNFTQYTRDWYDESKFIYDILEPGKNRSLEAKTRALPNVVWSYSNNHSLVERDGRGNFVPSFHISPPPIYNVNVIYENIDLFSDANYKNISLAAVKLKDAVFSRFDPFYAQYVSSVVGNVKNETEQEFMDHPRSVAAQPVYNKLDASTQKIVGYLYSIVSWEYYLRDLLPKGVNGVYVVLRNSCNQSSTYQLNGNEVCTIFFLCPLH